jgi:CelD/BcsL family acetyltransferase involved in cellulose biosynthesis
MILSEPRTQLSPRPSEPRRQAAGGSGAAGAAGAEAVAIATVERIDGPAELDALRPAWDELLAASSSAEIFLTWEWLATWWRCLGEGRRLAVLVVRRGDRPIALAPLVEARSLPPRFARSRLRFLGSGVVGSDYLDFVVRPGEGAAFPALADALDAARPMLDLVQVRADGSAVAELAGELERRGWLKLERATHCCPFLELEGRTWEGLVAGLGPSHRANLRRRLRQVEGAPGFSFRRATTTAEVDEAFEALIALHALRWGDRGGSDAFTDAAVVDFHRRFCRLAHERGWLRLYLLRLAGRPAAALYGFHYRGRFLYYQSGFDPAFAARSVGLVCLALSVREAIADGAREFDLLHGVERYKFLWARRARTLSRFELFPPTPVAGLAHLLQRSLRFAKEGLRRRAAPASGPTAWAPARSGGAT